MEQLSAPDLDALVAAKASCCSGLIQLATAVDQALAAALSSIGAWLIGGGYLWIGAAAGVLVIALHRHRAGSGLGDGAKTVFGLYTTSVLKRYRHDRVSGS